MSNQQQSAMTFASTLCGTPSVGAVYGVEAPNLLMSIQSWSFDLNGKPGGLQSFGPNIQKKDRFGSNCRLACLDESLSASIVSNPARAICKSPQSSMHLFVSADPPKEFFQDWHSLPP